MEQAQHHSSAIEQKSTLSNIESRRIKCAPLPSPFTTKDTISKKSSETHLKIKLLNTETYITRVRTNIIVATKMNADAAVPKATEEMNVDEVKTEHQKKIEAISNIQTSTNTSQLKCFLT